MTVATYTSDLSDIFLFEDNTGVSAYGGGAAGLGSGPDFAMEGTNANDKQITAADKGLMVDNGTNFTIGANDHFFIWLLGATPGLNDSRDNHGIHAAIGDDTDNFVKFHVDGNDTLPLGGGKVYPLRFVETGLTNFRTLVGAPGTTPSFIGGGLNTTGSVMGVNLGVDGARIGTGYDVLNGTGVDPEATFAGIASDDEGTSEGIFQTAQGGFNLQGKLRIGNSGTPCEFLDDNTNIFILDSIHSLTDFTEILVSDPDSILTLTNVNFNALGANNPGRLEFLRPIIDAQDETSYDDSPTSEGTFSGGTSHVVADVLTMSDGWTLITVDTVSSGVVTEFTVDATKSRTALAGVALTQLSSTGPGIDFSLTPDTDNLESGSATGLLTNCGFIDFGVSILDSGASLLDCRWIGSDIITVNEGDLSGSSVSGYEGTANTSPVIWDDSDPDGNLDEMTFAMGTNLTHAIEFGDNIPLTITLRGCDFTGYSASQDVNNSIFHFKDVGGTTITFNLIGCTADVAFADSYRTDGATIIIVEDPATTTFTVEDVGGDPIENARVIAETADAGDANGFPFEDAVTTLTQSGGVAELTASAVHGLVTGDSVVVRKAQPDGYNKVAVITVTSTTIFTYSVDSGLSSPATGTPVFSYCAIGGVLTNASGIVTSTRRWSSATPQGLKGWARKSTAAPFFRQTDINVADATGGTDLTLTLQSDG